MTLQPDRPSRTGKARWLLVPVALAAAVLGSLLWCGSAAGLTLYRIELTNGGVIFAESQPTPNGAVLSFLSSPQGTLVGLRRSEVARIIQMENLNRAPLDLGGASLKRAVVGVPVGVPSVPSRRLSVEETSSPSGSVRSRGYGAGDYTPGNRVAFPVSRDDLLPGNYSPYPAGRGGQTGPPPMLREGMGVPKAGTLREPPEAILLHDAPTAANMQVPAPALIYDEKPHVDEKAKAKKSPSADVPF
jgi:hypothetical protein